MTIRQKTLAAKQVTSGGVRALLQPEAWPQDATQALAEGEVPKGLSRDHIKVINYVRRYYLDFGTLPPVRLVVRHTEISLRCLRELFPQGYTKDISKSAGIPANAISIAAMHHVHSG